MDNLTEKLNSTQLLQNIQALKNAGKTTIDIQSYVDNYVKTSDGSYVIKTSDKLSQPKEQSFLKNTGQNIIETVKDVSETGTDIKSSFKERLSKFKEGNFYQKIGQSAGLASDVIGVGVKGIAKVILPQSSETAIKKGITNIAQPITESDFTQKILQKYSELPEETKKNIDATLGIGSLALDLIGGGAGVKGTEIATKTALKTGSKIANTTSNLIETGAKQLTEKGLQTTKLATEQLAKLSTPKKTAIDTVGEVLQGLDKDVKQGVKALSVVDTKGVKTYKDLQEAINAQIKKQSLKVDADLGLDKTKKLLKDLVIKTKTTSGNIIKSNPVEQAINHLNELYSTIGDNVKAANTGELLTKAMTKGLTNLEINNLAREYGIEFGKKAFGKTGEALTSVNARLYENVRSSLKSLARTGIKGKEAQISDAVITSLERTKNLVSKNIEAVNKIKQKIQDRGLLEQIGYAVSKYGDILTGGSLRGFVGGLLPRGVGNKTMNALDIEKALEKNLDLIQQAIKSGKDSEIVKILSELKINK